MEVLVPGKVMRLVDVPAGGVVGFFDQGRYVRFLRTALESQSGVTITSLGPFCDRDFDAHVQGPTSYFWEADTEVVFEQQTALAAKQDSITDPDRHIKLGSVVLTRSDQTCLLCRTGRGDRAFIDLTNGEIVKNPKVVALYTHYVLTAPDEVQKRRMIFDSSKQPANASAVA